MNISTINLCPTCNSEVEIAGNNDSTHYYIPKNQIKIGEYQICPICNGSGRLFNSAMHIAIDRICDVCNGAKIIAKPLL